VIAHGDVRRLASTQLADLAGQPRALIENGYETPVEARDLLAKLFYFSRNSVDHE
jgi:hypothetical protein